jgi:hypothetical protein
MADCVHPAQMRKPEMRRLNRMKVRNGDIGIQLGGIEHKRFQEAGD